MSKHLPTHLSYKSALVLLPHASITAPIEAVRRLHDKHFERWPPHINLLYPFLASPSDVSEQDTKPQLKETIRARIQKAVRSTHSFDVSLMADNVQRLQHALQAEFSECDADQRTFEPHLSVGQANSDNAADKLKGEIKSSIADFVKTGETTPVPETLSVALSWNVDQVFVIERKGYNGRFKVVGSIDLGKV